MKRGLIVLGFLFILIGIGIISALPLCVQGGYMDAMDCSFDAYSCSYSQRCVSTGTECLSAGCEWANFNQYSCKTRCSISYTTGIKTCYNCVWDEMTGICNTGAQCDNGNGTFCLPGLRKCGGANNILRQFCDGSWTTEENCSSTKMGVCAATYNFQTSTIDTSCMECDSDSDGFVPYRYSSLCPLCSGTECDCNDANANINPGKMENCSNLIDDNCDELIDNADPDCNQSVSTCSDSDGGNNTYVKGFVLGTDFIFVDSCNNTSGLLTEYFCVNNTYNLSVLACPSGYSCQNGICNQSGIDNQSNVTNCTQEKQFIPTGYVSFCCPGLSEFTVPSLEANFCNLGKTITGGFLGAFLGLRHSITGKAIVTEEVFCYDATKGTPECRNAGNLSEGWYYSGTGELIVSGICSSTCLEHTCQGSRFSCTNCGASFGLAWHSFRISFRTPIPPILKDMNLSQAGVDLIKQFEGFRSKMYVCAAGKKTIGYGHVILRGDTIRNTSLMTANITKAEAEELLRKDAKIAEKAVKDNVKVNLTQGQYDALVSFIFNVGTANFKKSTLLKKLNVGNYTGAADEFPKWNKGGGKVLPGLVTRRAAEKKLFESGATSPIPPPVPPTPPTPPEPDDGGVG